MVNFTRNRSVMKHFTFLLLLLLLATGCLNPSWIRAPVNQANRHLVSAHRGGRFIAGYPENALATFAYTHSLVPAAWIECDISMSADSVLFLLHDRELDRSTTGTGTVRELPWSVIDTVHLADDFGTVTAYEVPTLEEALTWARKNRVVYTLDVKRGVPFERVVAALDEADMINDAVVITYNKEDARRVYDLNRRIKLSVTIRNEAELEAMLATGIPPANWVAFTGTELAPAELFRQLHLLGVSCMVGTLGDIDEMARERGAEVYFEVLERGADVLATDRPVEAWQAIQRYQSAVGRRQ